MTKTKTFAWMFMVNAEMLDDKPVLANLIRMQRETATEHAEAAGYTLVGEPREKTVDVVWLDAENPGEPGMHVGVEEARVMYGKEGPVTRQYRWEWPATVSAS